MASSIIGFLRQHAEKNGDKLALTGRLSDGSVGSITYAELYQEVLNWAAEIHDVTGSEETVVPLFAKKSPAMVKGILASLAAGQCAAPLNDKLRPAQVGHVVTLSGARLGVIDNAALLALRGAEAGEIPLHCQWWWHDHSVAQKMHLNQHVKLSDWLPIQQWQQANEYDSFEPLSISGPGVCLFTSGSTGTPKGVLIPAADLVARAEAEVALFDLTAEDVLLNVLPFSFDVGLNQLLSSIVAGAHLVILDSWLPSDISNAVSEYGITGISGVPAIWQDFLQQNMQMTEQDSLRYITVSGGSLSHDQIEQLPGLADGLQVFKTYGQTEAFRLTALTPEFISSKPGSVGVPFGSAGVYIVGEQGELLPAGEEGEVVHTGLGTMYGYLGDTTDSNKRRKNPFKKNESDPEFAIFTGDYGFFDEDGFLFLRGRKDHMVKINGNRVYPNEIVPFLMAMPAIEDAAVVAVEDDNGYTLVAFLVGESEQHEAFSLMRTIGQKVASYMVPRHFLWLDSMPRTASGKPDLAHLQMRAIQHINN